ncbi:tRNA preQ1(34) S-adenosylmethionine ribosyltransferase-isomerase QueA [Candidatus Parcubacteria bacterium]|nr:MAG: tRNA preQ1(34) S-adenosylmethionine ribosyltransferase-isomerase QueA [Candidatus Parcubacteria bacterium]
MTSRLAALAPYDYRAPAHLIANKPAKPRDSARLLVHDMRTGRTAFDVFRNIGRYLPDRAVLVINETKVIPARLVVHKASGGAVALLALSFDRRGFLALAPKALAPGMLLCGPEQTRFRVLRRVGEAWRIKLLFPMRRLRTILERYGQAPIPPYIKGTPLSARKLHREYQSVFARVPGSVAAPTASLHFTPALMKKLERRGIAIERITLHVHLGTFAPLNDRAIRTGRLHAEYYAIPAAAARRLERAKQQGRPIIAVGTTVVRALESAADARGVLRKRTGKTRLFIRPGYRFQFVDGMITNFHVPKSSLLMLVAAFVGRAKLLGLYRTAIRRRFRLFSFGDAMFVLHSRPPYSEDNKPLRQ